MKLPRYTPNTEPPSWQIDYHNGPGDGYHRCVAYRNDTGRIFVCRDYEAAQELRRRHENQGTIIYLPVYGC